MINFLLFFLASLIFSYGLILIRTRFYQLSENTLKQLNTLLNDQLSDKEKQQLILTNTKTLLTSTVVFLFCLLVVLVAALLPFFLYDVLVSDLSDVIKVKSTVSIIALLLGGSLPFLLMKLWMLQRKDYSELSVLLHRLILNNYYVSKMLFRLDKRFNKRKLKHTDERFVIVSGLARSGTTGLATFLSGSESFHYLQYSNMPFLMCPNIWKKLRMGQRQKPKERMHGDKMFISYNSIEALEEYFFKVFTNDAYIKEKTLLKHDVDDVVYEQYLQYQRLIRWKFDSPSLYLAKNNNLILRYASMRRKNKSFQAIFLFRDPIEHASSLLNQHIRFSDIQLEDPFALEYMNWLGHHEFGLNQKYFQLVDEYIDIFQDRFTLNYWLEIWVNYHEYLLSFVGDENLILVSYTDLQLLPDQLISALEQKLQITVPFNGVSSFEKSQPLNKEEGNDILLKRANEVYQKLLSAKLNT